MPKILHALILCSLMPVAAFADASTTVIDHHVARMKAGDLAGVLSDYAPDAVVVTPPGLANASGVFVGADAKTLFAVLTDKDHVPGAKSMTTRYEPAGPGTTIMHWVQFGGTPQEVSGHDVFVIRGGKVVFQSVTVDAKK
jgi:hypothetical protein